MKKIEAFIKQDRIEAVANVLRGIDGLSGITVIHAEGFGRREAANEMEPSPEMIHDFRRVARLETFCNDDIVESVMETLREAAHTGLRHDGKIYVLPVDEAMRISSGRRGVGAV
jgi:nitrogen regulatory protein PII